MYLDTLNNVTVGIGSLMQAPTAPDELLALPWFDKTTKVSATRTQLRAEYEYVQSRTDLAPRGGRFFDSITEYRISDTVMDQLLWNETQSIWNRLVHHIPELPTWQADAQLCMLDKGFNLGPNFITLDRYEVWREPIFNQHFVALSIMCRERSTHRRWQNRAKLYANAALVIDLGITQETLWGLSPTNLKEMEMALAEDVVNHLLNAPLIDDPVTKTKRSLKYCVENLRNDAYRAYKNSDAIKPEVDQVEELLMSVLAEVDQTEEGIARLEALRLARDARLAAAYSTGL
jgi:hypothetical protein